MTRILGITALGHDASVSVIEDGKILFAAHAERYSRIKNDKFLNNAILEEAFAFGEPDKIVYYERPYLKKLRQLFAGQFKLAFDLSTLPSNYFKNFDLLKDKKIEYVPHHLSHAAAGALTSGFKEATVLVVDAIGEFDCVTIWKYSDPCKFTKVYSASYPNSLGLFYTAMTSRAGLKPNEEEYILMGMAAYGSTVHADDMLKSYFNNKSPTKMKVNLHRGDKCAFPEAKDEDIAASAQAVVERKLLEIVDLTLKLVPETTNLVYMGGVALNCVANSLLYSTYKDKIANIWTMPNPGDAGSSLGAAAYGYGGPVNWESPYLGTEIDGRYPVKKSMKLLLLGKMVGIANGKAEFGPRALGNRSLLVDPRGDSTKDRVNLIKHRQKFRPFAPVILEQYAGDFFEMPVATSPYMQVVARCKYPSQFPAIVHGDGTSRVQTVNKVQHPGLYKLLTEFYKQTGCPMLLNTSLNIKGQPIVNNENDAFLFEKTYGVKVFTKD